jgi:hypothetical protein
MNRDDIERLAFDDHILVWSSVQRPAPRLQFA